MTTKSTKQEEKQRSAAIMLAIEIDSAFKLYSFRIIDHETYVQQVTDLTKFYHHTIKASKNGQLDLETEAKLNPIK